MAKPAPAGWLLEQQSEELPLCHSQQESSRQLQQQHWVPRCLPRLAEHASLPEL